MPRRPPDERGAHQLWPVDTNLMKQVVASVGTQLLFNFQAVVIAWAGAVAVAWSLLGYFVDDALFLLGTRRTKTARQNCILLACDFQTQHRRMWTKVDFMIDSTSQHSRFVWRLVFINCEFSKRTDQASFTHETSLAADGSWCLSLLELGGK